MFQLGNFFYEQPHFMFNNELLIQVNHDSQMQQFNSINDFTNSVQNNIKQLKVSANLVDTNNDGVADLFQSNITFKSTPSQISQIDLLFLFNAKLQVIQYIYHRIPSNTTSQGYLISDYIQESKMPKY